MKAETDPKRKALGRLFHDVRGALNAAALQVEVARMGGEDGAERRARALEAATRQLERLAAALDRLEDTVLGDL